MLLYVTAAWMLPLMSGEVSGGLHGRGAALVPLVLLAVRLPAPLQAAFAALATVLAYAVALLLFRSQLL